MLRGGRLHAGSKGVCATNHVLEDRLMAPCLATRVCVDVGRRLQEAWSWWASGLATAEAVVTAGLPGWRLLKLWSRQGFQAGDC